MAMAGAPAGLPWFSLPAGLWRDTMSAIERLERLERMALMAQDLRRMIRKELAKTQRQVDEIERSISEGEDRCRAFENWDGKQPDTWLKAGKAWRKPTQDDCGKMVRVTMQLGVDPAKLPEAELLGFTREGEPIIKGTKGEGVCWSYAWIECYKSEPIDTDGKGYISVQVDGIKIGKPPILAAQKFHAFVNQVAKQIQDGLANKAEQADPLIDGQTSHCTEVLPERKKPGQADLVIDQESFLKPEPGTVVEDKWRPQVGEWVRIKKCDPTCCWCGFGMDYLDGQIRQIEELTTDGTGIVVDCFWLCGMCIYPWEPREGEKVQVINADRVYEVEGFDRITKMVFCVGRSLGIELRLLKPYIEPEKPAEDPQPELEQWTPKCGDWVRITKPESTSRYGNGYEWVKEIDHLDGEVHEVTRIIQCDTHKPGYQVREIDGSAYCLDPSWLSLAEKPEPVKCQACGLDTSGGTWCSAQKPGCPMPAHPPVVEGEEQPAKAPSCVTWYRDPTHADLANGPIEVEVCDAQTGDDHWETRTLLAICPPNIWSRYVTAYPDCTESTQTWRFARIKVEG